MLRKVYLQGEMGVLSGQVAEVNAATVREVIQYLDANFNNAKKYLLDAEDRGVRFVIKIAGEQLDDVRELLLPLDKGDIIITPVPIGSSGAIKAFIGAVLTIVGLATGQTWLTAIGLNLLSQGIAEMMAPDPATDNDDEQKEGYIFQGSEQSIPEGNPVPILYGELRVPGQPVTFDLRNSTEQALSAENGAGTYVTTGDGKGNLFRYPAFEEMS